MKLSIWRQFSSNHSANFTTVGQFESAEWAQEAYQEVQQILQDILWWHGNIQGEDSAIVAFNKILGDPAKSLDIPEIFLESAFIQFLADYNPKYPKTVAEAYYQQRYDVSDWRKPLDWLRDSSSIKALELFQDLVILIPGDTWAGYEPFHTILSKLGARVSSSLEGEYYFGVNFNCTAPDEASAEAIIKKIQISASSVGGQVIKIDGLGMSHQYRIELSTNGNEIQMKNCSPDRFGGVSLPEVMKGLIGFFQQEGCTNIEYRFARV